MGHAGLEFLLCAKAKNDILRTSKNTNQIMATVSITWSYFNVHWHAWPNDPIPLWHLVSVSAEAGARCLEAGVLWVLWQSSARGQSLKKRKEKRLSGDFLTHFFARFTSHLKRPSVKGLQGTVMSKYPHHHRRLQMSGHVSISAPPINTSVPLH